MAGVYSVPGHVIVLEHKPLLEPLNSVMAPYITVTVDDGHKSDAALATRSPANYNVIW